MSKIALITDMHSGVRGSSNAFLDYFSKFYDLFFEHLKEHNIKTIINLGDLNDNRKSISVKALNHLRKDFLNRLDQNGIKMYLILGNHDVYFKDSNQLNSPKETLGYFMKNVDLVLEPRDITIDNWSIALIPWINASNMESTLDFLKKTKSKYLGGHLELEGFEMYKGTVSTSGMSRKYFDRFKTVWSGHYHTKSTQDNITYLGAPYEMIWSDWNDPKFFHVFDTETEELTAIQNPYRIYRKCLLSEDIPSDLEDSFVKLIVDDKSKAKTVQEAREFIENQGVHGLDIIETFDEFEGVNVDVQAVGGKATSVLMSEYIDKLETELSKDRLTSRMQGLYVEAQTLE